jgi:5'-nucleotidase
MAKTIDDKLVLAISSRALFDLSESHKVYLSSGVEAYRQYQIEHEDEILEPGDAFPLVEKLLSLNTRLGRARVEVILVSRNSADTGLRVFNSIHHYGLAISRAAFVGGRSPYPYLKAFGCDLFLSTHAEDVRSALDAGFAAATILSGGASRAASDELRIAFDGDAVLFPTNRNGSISPVGWKRFRPASANRPANRCGVARSKASSPPSICCSASFPMTLVRFAPPW